ncbi:hypothetical protein QAD02_015793 [Eretmocerus hayati]|uniref:Uncharacterized protein n=1 Tax=Eretmocerus hayati TaxID=131215 RepID=A0ACC2PAZ0_9HYME|nr:hypothetical protein QAD02_015793 [Eretmocerus hayati]
MILPDDSNPAIVWDPVTKKWTNKDDDGSSSSGPPPPPPKMSEIPSFKPLTNPSPAMPATTGLPPLPPGSVSTLQIPTTTPTTSTMVNSNSAPTLHQPSEDPLNSSKLITSGGGNMYKLPRGRNMRANYVDVMNPGGAKQGGSQAASPAPTPMGSPATPMAASSPQLFIPTPVNDVNAPVDFLTPAASVAPQLNENSQALSRWSSTSSLSREVQSYTMRDPWHFQRDKGPMMYNPVDMRDRSSLKNQSRTRYPPR